MVKRAVKKRFRNIFIAIVYVAIAILALISLIYIAKNFLPKILGSVTNSNNTILRPVVDLTSISDVESKLADRDILLESINDSTISGAIVAQVKDGPTVYFSKSTDASSQVTSLQLILARLTIDNKKIQFIDLRGARPIVKFSSL